MRFILVSIFVVSLLMVLVLSAHAKADSTDETILSCMTHGERVPFSFTITKSYMSPPARAFLKVADAPAKEMYCRPWAPGHDKPIIPLLTFADSVERWFCAQPV